MSIKAIDKTSVHRITSGQVVIDLQTAVKELLENSLDAGATSIEIRFKNYGIDALEVVDNGSGIANDSFDGLAAKHHTSKLASYADLATVRTFGFRGEALSSLCSLSESVTVTTTTQAPLGILLELDARGAIRKKQNAARQRGTTVVVINLFAPLPVRRKEFVRNSKREFGKALALLNAYALVPCAQAGVKLTVTNQTKSGSSTLHVLSDAGVANTDDVAAVDALARTIDKEDFSAMDIVGQFNKGFIIIRRQKILQPPHTQSESSADGTSISSGCTDDLFIVDQHAADEKYNFESLQLSTKIQSQRLLYALPLELTAADEMVALEHLDILRQNGFEVEVIDCDSNGENRFSPEGDVDDDDVTVNHRQSRLKLVAQPVSKSTSFDVKDLEELVHLLHDYAPGRPMVRCSKARAMFASRACRKSVMVGMALNKAKMAAVVHHMGTMDQPWNCPHGRPTMRHLYDINSLRDPERHNINWASL
ncbi:hypothetical protein FISHEDRAFT_40913 [Fistulina hepatica ATCC 64428]|uniref:MutL C-terminal dimerisation domain-containing protein n=1 Tax=Fistulina hepatica ATCC 64428 TaxID=1128425 RepID=A0A0D7AET8_9AGAR|nr:hypothetical protein FISHEDRAFT_40913 [Fistulina hepatica ATCC 64428]